MKFIYCACYLAATGILAFVTGRLISKIKIDPNKGIFKCFSFENGGKIYEALSIRRWQNKLPDMSRILPFAMPEKKLGSNHNAKLPTMIQETCVAELIHLLHSITGLYCIEIWPGNGGIVVSLINFLLLNFPFIIIQRFNRPRLLRLYQRQRTSRKEAL